VQLSSWTVVLLTAERVISVWLPLKCKELCSRRRVIGVWCGIFVLLCGCNLHFFFTFDLQPIAADDIPGSNETSCCDCLFNESYEHFWYDQWYWIDSIIRSFIPFGLILIGNIFIISRLSVSLHMRKSMQLHAAGNTDSKEKGGKVSEQRTYFT
jgi:hypothetical protein